MIASNKTSAEPFRRGIRLTTPSWSMVKTPITGKARKVATLDQGATVGSRGEMSIDLKLLITSTIFKLEKSTIGWTEAV